MVYIVWFACSIGAGIIASSKKRSFLGWLLLGGLFGPIALLVVGFMAKSDTAGYGEKICPYCAETIKSKATVCKYCGKEVEPVLPTILPIQTSLKPLGLVVLFTLGGLALLIVYAWIYNALENSIQHSREIAEQQKYFPKNDKYDVNSFQHGGNTEISYILSINNISQCLKGVYIYKYITTSKVHILCSSGDGEIHEYTVYTGKDVIKIGFQ